LKLSEISSGPEARTNKAKTLHNTNAPGGKTQGKEMQRSADKNMAAASENMQLR
jgi:hypothetical protein